MVEEHKSKEREEGGRSDGESREWFWKAVGSEGGGDAQHREDDKKGMTVDGRKR